MTLLDFLHQPCVDHRTAYRFRTHPGTARLSASGMVLEVWQPQRKTTLISRIPYAVQWVWPIPLAILAYYAPDAPAWLVRKGRQVDAIASLRRLTSKVDSQELEDQVAMMAYTDQYEAAHKTHASFWDLFKGANLRRTEIAFMVYVSTTWCGDRFAYNPTYYFQQAGMTDDQAYSMNLGSNGLSFFCVFIVWFLIPYVGRRTLMVGGIGIMGLALLLVGCLAFSPTQAALWSAGAMIMVWIATYNITVGTLVYVVAGEISATKLRNYTFGFARGAYLIVNLVDKSVNPYLINPTAANLKGKTAFVWFGTNTLVLLWAIFRLPETKGVYSSVALTHHTVCQSLVLTAYRSYRTRDRHPIREEGTGVALFADRCGSCCRNHA